MIQGDQDYYDFRIALVLAQLYSYSHIYFYKKTITNWQ